MFLNISGVSFCLFPLSNVKGREEAGRVTGLTSHLTSHTSADERFDNSSRASRDEMENIMQKEGWRAKNQRCDGQNK